VSDLISGIKIVTPTYPVKPVQPASRDRRSGKRKSDKRETEKPKPDRDVTDDDDDNKRKIDEYV